MELRLPDRVGNVPIACAISPQSVTSCSARHFDSWLVLDALRGDCGIQFASE